MSRRSTSGTTCWGAAVASMHVLRAWSMMAMAGLVFLAAVVLTTAVSAYEDCGEAGPVSGCASVSTNAAPEPDFAWSETNGTVAFTDESTDDGAIVRWLWTFGDGGSSTAQHPSHAFAPGSYGVRLQVEDDDGAVANTTRIVEVPGPDSDDDGSGDASDSGDDTDNGTDSGADDDDAVTGDNATAGDDADGHPSDGNGTGSGDDTTDGSTGDADGGQDDGAASGSGNGTAGGGNASDGGSSGADDGDGTANGSASGDADERASTGAGAGGSAGGTSSGHVRSAGDADSDGAADDRDVCPTTPDDQADADGDGIGDACDDSCGCHPGPHSTTSTNTTNRTSNGTADARNATAHPPERPDLRAPLLEHYETEYPPRAQSGSDRPPLWIPLVMAIAMLVPGAAANTWRTSQHVARRKTAFHP